MVFWEKDLQSNDGALNGNDVERRADDESMGEYSGDLLKASW